MENVYNINWEEFIRDKIPPELRTPIFEKYVLSLTEANRQLFYQFLAFRIQAIYKVSHNSQVVYLQKMLNDKFDPVARRIRVANAVIKEPVWFFEVDDDKPVWFYNPEDNNPVDFNEESDLLGDNVDFRVLVPIQLKPSTAIAEEAYIIKMSAQINYYKLFSKNYKIIWQST